MGMCVGGEKCIEFHKSERLVCEMSAWYATITQFLETGISLRPVLLNTINRTICSYMCCMSNDSWRAMTRIYLDMRWKVPLTQLESNGDRPLYDCVEKLASFDGLVVLIVTMVEAVT